MRILITNDDGVNSSGIIASKKAINGLAEITVVAPATQQSGIGHALTLFEPIRVTDIKLRDDGKAFSVSGTPTDAVILGIFELAEKKPDLVISGINVGENLGKSELTTSGTIGAAMEAATHGIPALAVSLQVTRGEIKFHDGHVDIDFSFAKKITRYVVKQIIKKGLPEGIDFLNLNIPAQPQSDEIIITDLGERMYQAHIQKRLDPRGRPYYWLDGHPVGSDRKYTDVHTLKVVRKPSLTPLSLDCTSNMSPLKEWID